MEFSHPENIITPIDLPDISSKNVALYMLRLDKIHPVISGNKWFKLKYNLQEAKSIKCDTLISFGGAYSNHLAAFSYAAKAHGLKSIAFIRGIVKEKDFSATLRFLKENGTTLYFLTREEYKKKEQADFIKNIQLQFPDALIIPEGGNNPNGLKGCEEIGDFINQTFHFVAVSIGTGTTLKGLINNTNPLYQHVMGYSSLKGEDVLCKELKKIHENSKCMHTYQLIREYSFGGFAKYNQTLIDFIKNFYNKTQIELDFVYTAKMMYGILDQIKSNFFAPGSKILAIHTGGLQGNWELKNKGLLKI